MITLIPSYLILWGIRKFSKLEFFAKKIVVIYELKSWESIDCKMFLDEINKFQNI